MFQRRNSPGGGRVEATWESYGDAAAPPFIRVTTRTPASMSSDSAGAASARAGSRLNASRTCLASVTRRVGNDVGDGRVSHCAKLSMIARCREGEAVAQ